MAANLETVPGRASARRATAGDRGRVRGRKGRTAAGPHTDVALLGLGPIDSAGLFRAVERGLSYAALERFRRNTSLPVELILALVDIPRRTLTRRKRTGRLRPGESDRLVRAARVFGRALQLFEGDRDAALEWLTSSQRALGGAVPIDLVTREVGARDVEQLIGRLEYGVYV
jgi:putative toxin-antitoxin system antitoxin component (TIGR02293 family)